MKKDTMCAECGRYGEHHPLCPEDEGDFYADNIDDRADNDYERDLEQSIEKEE